MINNDPRGQLVEDFELSSYHFSDHGPRALLRALANTSVSWVIVIVVSDVGLFGRATLIGNVDSVSCNGMMATFA